MKISKVKTIHLIGFMLLSVVILVGGENCKSKDYQDGFMKVNGVDLYYKIYGKSKTEPIVVLHGGPGGDHNIILPLKELKDKHQVIFFDQRTTGNSSGKVHVETITLDNFIEDVEGLRKGLKLSKFHLIGHSWGGILALYYAIKYPDNLKSLTVFSIGGASAEYFPIYQKNFKERISQEDDNALRKIAQSKEYMNNEPDAYKKFYSMVFKAYFKDQSLVKKLNLDMGENTAKNQNTVSYLMIKNMGFFNFYDQLKAINCPTLFLHGLYDLFPVEGVYKTHRHMPQSKLVVLKDAGHMMYIDAKDAFFKIVRAFLNDPNSVENIIPQDLETKLKALTEPAAANKPETEAKTEKK